MDSVKVDTFGLPINKDISFATHKSRPSERAMKRQLKVLQNFAPLLKQLLKSDEEILLAVRACSPMSMFEQLTTGWMIFYLKRCVLVFTNKRILHFPTGTNFRPKSSIAEIFYGDIAEAKVRGFFGRALTLKYRTGKEESFNYVESPDFKKLKAILPSLPKETHPSEVSERHHLCPRCQARLLKGRFNCPACHLQFKDGERAIRLSILFPGGGYFYTKHPFMGIGYALAEGALLILVIAGFINVLMGGGGSEGWGSVLSLAVALIIAKIETIFHAKHYVNEYIPLDKNLTSALEPATFSGS